MDSPALGNGLIGDSTGTSPPNSPPTRHRAVDSPANNPPVQLAINIPTETIPATADDRFLNRRIKKSDGFALGLFFATLCSLNSQHSGDHSAIALVLKFIAFIVSLFLYLCSSIRNPGPKFQMVRVTLLVIGVVLLVLAIFLDHHA